MFIIRKNQKLGRVVLIMLLILSILPPFLITYTYNYSMLAIKIEDVENYFNIYYLKPYTYATTYIIGLIGGVIYNRFASQTVKISKVSKRI